MFCHINVKKNMYICRGNKTKLKGGDTLFFDYNLIYVI